MTVTWGQIDGDFNGKNHVSRVTGLTMLAANHRPDVRLAVLAKSNIRTWYLPKTVKYPQHRKRQHPHINTTAGLRQSFPHLWWFIFF